jgi:hypothetical protein
MMLIELYRKLTAGEDTDICVICGNDHAIGSVYAMTCGDHGEEGGPLCPTCLDYLGRRKLDPEDPASKAGYWPARDWPTVEVLRDLQRRYPEAMFDTEDDLLAASTDREAASRIHDAAMVWRMEREQQFAR